MKKVRTMNNSQMINQTSHSSSYGTPQFIVDAARELMGGIDLDPASASWANERVGARRYYTKEDDGLSKKWVADSVFMNHPFSDGEEACKLACKKKRCVTRGYCITERVPSNKEWIDKLVSSYASGGVENACCITFAATSEGWFGPLQNYPQCFLRPRTNYYLPDGTMTKGVPKGSVVTYLGSDVASFGKVFHRLGKCFRPIEG